MSVKEKLNDELFVVVINSIEERNELKKFCEENDINITYPSLFEEEDIHPLWGLDKNGVGLVGTMVVRFIPSENVFHSVGELKSHFER